MIPPEEVWGRVEAFRRLTPGRLRVIHGRSNVRYLTGLDGGGFTPWLIIGDQNITAVFYTADEDSLEQYSIQELRLRPFSPDEDVLEVVREAVRSEAASSAIVGDLQWWTHSEVAGLNLDVEEGSEAIRSLRVVKSEWEQSRLRESGVITQSTMDQLETLIDQGATARDLAIALYQTAIGLGSGPFTYLPYVAVGGATLENHTTWDWDREKGVEARKAGAYLFEFATNVDGYGTPLSRSRCEDRDGQLALAAVERGISSIRSALRPGSDPAEMHRLMLSSIESAGFRFAHRAGYSIGLGEAETWMEGELALLGPLARYEIRHGMAFHVVGSVVVRGRFGVARSNSLLVTADGVEILAA